MAWLYKRGKRWWVGYRVGTQQFLKPTKQTDRTEAEKVLNTLEAMENAKRADRLNEDFYEALTGKSLPIVSVKAALSDWLDECRRSTAKGTFDRYEDVANQFLAYLKADDNSPLLRDIETKDVTGFLNASAKTLAGSSVNLARKILSTFFNRAAANGQVNGNPVKATKRASNKRKNATRRAYELAEIRSMLTKTLSSFWRYMITGGIYTGLRMGDLIRLRRNEINLEANTLRIVMGKTDDAVEIPIAPPFRSLITARLRELGTMKGTDYLWPVEAARYDANRSGVFSNEFYKVVLQPCGLVPPRANKKAQKHGRGVRRQLNDVSFHSFRHTFISLLKSSGASQSVAKELAGHSSDAVSDLYTHVSPEHMRQAIALLPEVSPQG